MPASSPAANACEPAWNLASRTLYGILDLGYVAPADAVGVARQMLAGGVELLQLRAKKQPLEAVAALARQLQPLAAGAGVPFLLNDHPQLAAELGLDGVHVGQDDLSVSRARALLGQGKIVGLSTHSVAQALAARDGKGPGEPPCGAPAAVPDYIGFGPLFATPTKPDYRPIGTAEIRRVHAGVPLPIFCIGGVKRENLAAVLAAGARRVVIVSGILQAADIAAYCREARALLAGPSHAGADGAA